MFIIGSLIILLFLLTTITMKLSSSILSAFLFTQTASAFTSQTNNNRAILSSLSSAVVAEPTTTATNSEVSDRLSDIKIKYETDVDYEQKFKVAKVDPTIFDPKRRVQTGRYNDKENSIAIPFLKRPSKLDGTHAGDVGFDPLGLSESNDMYTMMEAEIRHARLAM